VREKDGIWGDDERSLPPEAREALPGEGPEGRALRDERVWDELGEAFREVVASDAGGRGVASLYDPRAWARGVGLLARSRHPVLVTGFVVPPWGVAETDGPPGVAVLARALKGRGVAPRVVTDDRCLPVVRAACEALGGARLQGSHAGDGVLEPDSDLLVFVERLGRAEDGGYYNMRGEEIGAWTAPLDDAAALARARGIPVVAVGDGGNEAGMGNYARELGALVPAFSRCLSVVPADATLVVDVSNWGAYILAAGLSLEEGRWLGHDEEEEEALGDAMVAAGAVDGATKRPEATVDGLPPERHRGVVRRIRELWERPRRSF